MSLTDGYIQAREVKQAFKKKNGSLVYIRMSPSSIRLLGLDANMVYGVSPSGDITRIKPDSLVVEMPIDSAASPEKVIENAYMPDVWEE